MEKENSVDNLVASASEEDQKHEEKHSKFSGSSDSTSNDDFKDFDEIPKMGQSKFYVGSSDSSSSGTSSDKNCYTNHDQELGINEVNVPGIASSERFLMEELDRDRGRKKALEPRSTNNNSYEYITFLGEGYFGTVFKAYDKTKKIHCAIKFIRDISFMHREFKMMEILNHGHPNIVQLIAHYCEESSTLPSWVRIPLAEKEGFKEENKTAFGILMEFCDGGTLEDALGKTYHEAIRHEWSLQFLQGLEFIHKFNIMHRDLKPKNILLCNEKVKIGDFGTAKKMDSEDCEATCTPDPVRNMYRAPELKGKRYNIKGDIYSAGCILLMLKNPSSSERDRHKYLGLVKGGILPAELEYGKEGKEMIQKMVAINPSDRVDSVAEIIAEYYEEKELDPTHVRLMQENLD